MPAILVALIFRTLDALRIFDLPYVLTNGANGTTTLSLIAHQEFAANRSIGYGSALSILTFIIVMAVSFIYIRTVGGNIRGAGGGADEAMAESSRPTPASARARRSARRPAGSTPRPTAQLGPPAGSCRSPSRRSCIFCLFPFYWLINVSLKTGSDLCARRPLPAEPDARQLQSIFKNDDFTAALTTARSSRCRPRPRADRGLVRAYALARLRFKRKFLILALILSITTFPPIAIAAPMFRLWTDIGLYNTLIGLIIPYLTFALPLAIYILVSFFKEIPKDLEEAALVDGATYFQAFRKVVRAARGARASPRRAS